MSCCGSRSVTSGKATRSTFAGSAAAVGTGTAATRNARSGAAKRITVGRWKVRERPPIYADPAARGMRRGVRLKRGSSASTFEVRGTASWRSPRRSPMSEPLHVVCPACDTVNRVLPERAGEGASCGRCRAALFPGRPVELNAANFERQVGASDVPVVVDFWAPWCGPCRAMAPAYEQAAQRLGGKVRLAKLDTEAEPGVGRALRASAASRRWSPSAADARWRGPPAPFRSRSCCNGSNAMPPDAPADVMWGRAFDLLARAERLHAQFFHLATTRRRSPRGRRPSTSPRTTTSAWSSWRCPACRPTAWR